MTTQYADPEAAAGTLARIDDLATQIRALELPVEKLCEMAVLTAHTYIAGDQDAARAYYQRRLAEDGADGREDLLFEATEALVWTSLFGPNGSDGQHAASHTLRWSKEYARTAN